MMSENMIDTMDGAVLTHDHLLTDYAAGNLSPAKHIMVSCQSDLCPEIAERIAFQEDIAASLLEDKSAVSLSPLFIGEVLSNLPDQEGDSESHPQTFQRDMNIAPSALKSVLGHGLRDMKWKSMIPGVYVHDVLGDRHYSSGERLYLLRVKGGMKMPEHSHKGEEWSLILTGSYRVGDRQFKRGDLHIEDESETHAPVIDSDEDCICLVMTEGPLVMKSLIPRLMQPFMGI